jgi:hypothetical protein
MTIKRDYYHYLPTEGILYIDVVVGLAWSNDPESYDGGSYCPMPDRSKVMTQTKRDTLVLQVGGWA